MIVCCEIICDRFSPSPRPFSAALVMNNAQAKLRIENLKLPCVHFNANLQLTRRDRDTDAHSKGACALFHTGARWYSKRDDSGFNSLYLSGTDDPTGRLRSNERITMNLSNDQK